MTVYRGSDGELYETGEETIDQTLIGGGDYSNEGRQYGGDTSITALDPTTSGIWSNVGNDWLTSLKNLFTGTSSSGALGQAAAFGGLATLLQKLMGSQSAPVIGYQGGIPDYTLSRTQTPISQQRPAGYRPGQGGITYFQPMSYSTQGDGGISSALPDGSTSGGPVISPDVTQGEPAPINPYYKFNEELFSDEGALSKQASASDIQSLQSVGLQAPVKSPVVTTKTIMPVTEPRIEAASGGYMPSGIARLAGGRFLRGPGDGVSDSIKARFADSGEPARLADGEFVLDARTVSEIGNGSSEAGARKLYEMIDRIQKARRTASRGKPSNADKNLPA